MKPQRNRNILFCCQVLDSSDPAMSFFHDWVQFFSSSFQKITVIALQTGVIELSSNVRHFSLGKESIGAKSFKRLRYAARLLYLAIRYRDTYDEVFVHMNQEYLLVCGIVWRLLGKKVYLWYNHYSGSVLTKIAGLLCNKVFYTSRSSYTASFRNAVQMPVGIQLDRFFRERTDPSEKERSILFLARISASKRVKDLISALHTKEMRTMPWNTYIIGPTVTPDDKEYAAACEKYAQDLGISERIHFGNGVPFSQTPDLYGQSDIFVNCSRSGMYDKTIFEAAASGCIVIASSTDYRDEAGESFYFTYGEPDQLSKKLLQILSASETEWIIMRNTMRSVAEKHSLYKLRERIIQEIYG